MTDNNSQEAEYPRMLAAVDLGSNSFHMLIGRTDGTSIQVVDRLKEMVRLGAGLDNKNRLSNDAQDRALACLERFSQRIQNIDAEDIRIVGTNTLRVARNSKSFLAEAENILNHPIDIISGIEEARLIYLGVSHSLAETGSKRLVVDIGGGSTETIIGERFTPLLLESTKVGCVNISKRFFPDGRVTEKRLAQAELHAMVKLESLPMQFIESGWSEAIGSSGSIRSIAKISQANGFSNDGITLESMRHIRQEILRAGHYDNLKLDGLSEARRPVFAGGYLVLQSIFNTFELTSMRVSDGAVREGLTYELIGRIRHEDVRETTIEAFSNRYSVDLTHAGYVFETAMLLYNGVKKKWKIKDEEHEQLLNWSCRLHEVGLAIAHADYHKHGSYLTRNSDLPGFSYQEQENLATLIRFHRGKFDEMQFMKLHEKQRRHIIHLCIILRIAIILQRSRTHTEIPVPDIKARKNRLRIAFEKSWLQDHPLICADLEDEKIRLQDIGFTLKIREI